MIMVSPVDYVSSVEEFTEDWPSYSDDGGYLDKEPLVYAELWSETLKDNENSDDGFG